MNNDFITLYEQVFDAEGNINYITIDGKTYTFNKSITKNTEKITLSLSSNSLNINTIEREIKKLRISFTSLILNIEELCLKLTIFIAQ